MTDGNHFQRRPRYRSRWSRNGLVTLPAISSGMIPVSRHGHFMEAVLWPQVRRPDVAGVVSDEAALAIHGLSDVNPARVHVTLPTAVRIRRQVPKGLVIHYADLAPEDVEHVEGVPVTTPELAIRDAHASRVGNALVAQAIAGGRRSGALSTSAANRLDRELFGSGEAPAGPYVAGERRGERVSQAPRRTPRSA
jgi:hypothetical protein